MARTAQGVVEVMVSDGLFSPKLKRLSRLRRRGSPLIYHVIDTDISNTHVRASLPDSASPKRLSYATPASPVSSLTGILHKGESFDRSLFWPLSNLPFTYYSGSPIRDYHCSGPCL